MGGKLPPRQKKKYGLGYVFFWNYVLSRVIQRFYKTIILWDEHFMDVCKKILVVACNIPQVPPKYNYETVEGRIGMFQEYVGVFLGCFIPEHPNE